MNISAATWKWLLIGSGLAMLLMMLAYPFGYDQAAFMVGGEMTVKHGAIPYRDFLDTKPPIIFFIYGISSLLFGHHEWSIRAFDILFHIGSLFYFFKLLKRATGDEKLALTSAFFYALFYVTSGYWMTAQAETFALLPSLVAFDLTDRVVTGFGDRESGVGENLRSNFVLGIFAGLASAVLFLLKFTLLTVPLGIIIYLLLESKEKKHFPWKYLLGIAAGFLILVGGYFLFLYEMNSLTRFMESLAWLKSYADVDPLFSMHTIIERYFKQFPMLAIYPFGLSGILLAAVGALWYFKDHLKPVSSEERKKDSSLLHLFVQFSLAMLAVLYERKFFPYHFARSYWAFVPFVALGLRELRNLWKDYSLSWIRLKIQNKILRCTLLGLVIAALICFSIAPRIISQPLHFGYLRLSGQDVTQDVQDKTPQYFYKEEQQIADRLKPAMKEGDKVFVWGNSVGIYYFLESYPTTICLTNTPLITTWTPESWKTTMLNQLREKPPRFFIAESGDDREYISGSKTDSWRHLLGWSDLKDFVGRNYVIKEELGHFRIFERKLSEP
ncbi:MAG: ArnT family glycosyltransferase [Candidatus Kapaibacterium sp.]